MSLCHRSTLQPNSTSLVWRTHQVCMIQELLLAQVQQYLTGQHAITVGHFIAHACADKWCQTATGQQQLATRYLVGDATAYALYNNNAVRKEYLSHINISPIVCSHPPNKRAGVPATTVPKRRAACPAHNAYRIAIAPSFLSCSGWCEALHNLLFHHPPRSVQVLLGPMHAGYKNSSYPLLLLKSFIVSARTKLRLPEASVLPRVQTMGVRKVWAQSREKDRTKTQLVNELRQLSDVQAKIQAAKAELEENQKKLQAQNTLLKDTQCGLKFLVEQMDTAKEEVAMWQEEAEVSQTIVASLRKDYCREVRAIRSVIPHSAAGSERTYTNYLVDQQGEKAYWEIVTLIKRLLARKKKLQGQVHCLHLEGDRLCNKTEQHMEALPGLETRLANLDEAIQAKTATLAELDKLETEKFAKLDSLEYLLATTTDKLNQQLEQVQTFNLEIERLNVVRVACQLQSESDCRPNGSTQATMSTQAQVAAPAPSSLCASCRCSLTDAPITNSGANRAVNTARVHDSIAEPVDNRYTDIESVCDADADCQVLVSGSKHDGQQQVSSRYTFKSFAAKAKNACKKLLIKRSSSQDDGGAGRSSSSSCKVGSNRQVSPGDMLSATTIWKWSTRREYRRDNPLYVKAGDLQMMLDSPPVGGHAPNSGLPLIW